MDCQAFIAFANAVGSIGYSVQQATESIKKITEALNEAQEIVEVSSLEEQLYAPKVDGLKSKLKTLKREPDEYNMTEVVSNAHFDF